jgi:adenosine deaminase
MPTLTVDEAALIQALPKAELHVHLEGSMRPTTALDLARHYGVDLGCPDEAGLRELYRFRDFRHFIDLYLLTQAVLRTPDDFVRIIRELAEDGAASGARYMEATFTMVDHVRNRGIPADEILDALAAGAAAARQASGVEMRFILDHSRGYDIDECWRVAEWCVQGRERGVVGMGMGGFEPGRPLALFAEAIRWAQAQGVPFVPHAGEAVGPEAVWEALDFGVTRIGHGVRAADDPALVAELVKRGTVLELCPTSNVLLRNVPSLEAHPLRRLWDAGVAVTINSDDPPMFNTTLLNEYQLAATAFGFTPADLAQVSRTAIGAAFLPPAEKAHLAGVFESALHELGL